MHTSICDRKCKVPPTRDHTFIDPKIRCLVISLCCCCSLCDPVTSALYISECFTAMFFPFSNIFRSTCSSYFRYPTFSFISTSLFMIIPLHLSTNQPRHINPAKRITQLPPTSHPVLGNFAVRVMLLLMVVVIPVVIVIVMLW